MKVAVLSRDPGLYANRRLHQAAALRGMPLVILDPVGLDPDSPAVLDVEAVIARFGPRWQRQGHAALAAFEARGVIALNRAEAVALARDKFGCLHRFASAGLPLPRSVLPPAQPDRDGICRLDLGFPLLLKRSDSMQGDGVALCHDAEDLMARMRTLSDEGVEYYLQAFIAEAAGTDLRLLVLDGEVIAAIQRTAQAGEFRANAGLGARCVPHLPTTEEARLAIQATQGLGLTLGGVDILRSRRGPLLLEVNACPGFEAVEAATGCDVAGKLLDCLASRKLPQNGASDNQMLSRN